MLFSQIYLKIVMLTEKINTSLIASVQQKTVILATIFRFIVNILLFERIFVVVVEVVGGLVEIMYLITDL